MPIGTVEEIMPIRATEVFAVIHDYDRRLEWDTLLSEAYIEPPYDSAGKGVVTVCRGRRILGNIAIRTEYVTFEKGKVAAVRMLKPTSFFETFAASIRHLDLEDGRSSVVYKFNFTSRPSFMRPILEPVMLRVLTWETGKRLTALREFCSQDLTDRSFR